MESLQKRLIKQAEKRDRRRYDHDNVKLVMSFLSYSGSKRSLLTDSQYVKAYLLCNGFGEINLEFAKEAEFDWSHVRDSSPIGFDRAAGYLRTLKLQEGTIKLCSHWLHNLKRPN